MKKTMKQMLAWVFVFVMIFSVMPSNVWASQTVQKTEQIQSVDVTEGEEATATAKETTQNATQEAQATQQIQEETVDAIKTAETTTEATTQAVETDTTGQTTQEATTEAATAQTNEASTTETEGQTETTENQTEATEATATTESEVEATVAKDSTEASKTEAAAVQTEATEQETTDTIAKGSSSEKTKAVSFEQEYAKPGTALSVVYTGTETNVSYVWYVDNEKIDCTQSSYTPAEGDIEKMIKVEVYDGEKKLGEASMLCSKLPVVYIDTENAQPIVSKEQYIDANMKIQGNDTYNLSTTKLYDGEIEIRGRGNSTWARFDKKPYKIKLGDSTSLFDMGKSKHWALIANYIDGSLMRNHLASNIGKQLGVVAMDSVWVDVVLNGECVGNYQLYESIKLSKDRVDIFDWDDAAGEIAKKIAKKEKFSDDDKDALKDYMEQHMEWMTSGTVTYNGVTYQISDYYTDLPETTTGGYLMEMEAYPDEASYFRTTRGVPIQFKNPEYIKTDKTAYTYIKTYMQKLEDAIYSTDHCITDGGSRISYVDYCDMDTLTAYWLSCELLKNEIGWRSNYMHKDENLPVKFGPIWDFDFSSDSVAPFGGQSATKWQSSGRWWFSQCMTDPYFAVKAKELYEKNIDYLKSLGSDDGLLKQWHGELKESADKDFSIWSYSRTFDEDYTVLKNWMTKRLSWMDKQFASDASTFASLGVPLSSRFDLTLDGTSVTSGESGSYYSPYEDGQTFNLSVNVKNGTYPTFSYYVNGRYVADGEITNNQATVSITQDLLTEDLDSKNVISVWLKDGNGTLAEQQCVTLTVQSGDKTYNNVTFHDQLEDKTNVYAKKKTQGGKILLPDTSLQEDRALFVGWTDGTNTYEKNTYFTVEKDTDLYAVYEACKDGSYYHDWEGDGSVVTCKNCQKQKTVEKNYVHVGFFEYYLKNKYSNAYTGSEVKTNIVVSYNGTVLTEGVDYTISYKNNVEPGYATYKVTGIESAGYTGETELSYKIIAAKMTSGKMKVKIDPQAYTGKAIIPSLSVTYYDQELELGKDYKIVSCTDNVNIGTASITLEGMGNYSLQVTKTFKIVPQKATNIKTSVSGKNVTLTWKKVKNVTGYRVYRSTDNVNYTCIKTLKGEDVLTYTDKKTNGNTKYYYKLRAYVDDASSTRYYGLWSNAVSAKIPRVYQMISVVKVTPMTYNSIKVSWRKVSGVTGYRVYRSTDGKNYERIKTIQSANTGTYTDKTVQTGTTYYYKVRPYVKAGSKLYYGAYTSAPKTKAALGTVTLHSVKSSSSKRVALKWSKVSGASGYTIYRAASSKSTYKAVKKVTALTWTDTGLKKGRTYYYKVRAYRTVNGKKVYGAYSKVKSVKVR